MAAAPPVPDHVVAELGPVLAREQCADFVLDLPGRGLTYREAHLLMEILADSRRVRSLDIVEINPILDDRNRTAELAVELAASLLGQRIL